MLSDTSTRWEDVPLPDDTVWDASTAGVDKLRVSCSRCGCVIFPDNLTPGILRCPDCDAEYFHVAKYVPPIKNVHAREPVLEEPGSASGASAPASSVPEPDSNDSISGCLFMLLWGASLFFIVRYIVGPVADNGIMAVLALAVCGFISFMIVVAICMIADASWKSFRKCFCRHRNGG